MKNNKLFLDILHDVVSDLDMTVTIIDQKDSFDYEFECWTSCGGDFVFDIVLNPEFEPIDFMKELLYFTDGFDPDYETYIWLDSDGHGKNGAPYHIKDLLKDNEERLEILNNLYDTLQERFNEKLML